MWSQEDLLILLLSTRLPICYMTRSQLAATWGCFVPSTADIKWRERLHGFNHKQRDKIRTSVCTVSDGNKDMASTSMCQNLQIRVQTEVFLFLFTPLGIVHCKVIIHALFDFPLHFISLFYLSAQQLYFWESWVRLVIAEINTHTHTHP